MKKKPLAMQAVAKTPAMSGKESPQSYKGIGYLPNLKS